MLSLFLQKIPPLSVNGGLITTYINTISDNFFYQKSMYNSYTVCFLLHFVIRKVPQSRFNVINNLVSCYGVVD